MRIMGLDLGSKTCGVAISDDLLLTCHSLEVIRRKEENKLRHTLRRLEELTKEYDIDRIILGYPKNMDGSEGERCRLSTEFAEKLKKRTDKEVILWDERLTTVEAIDLMKASGIKSIKEREKIVDMIAAKLILEDYLGTL